jgi:uncharacterized membrane protein YdjX (TVP38/TMEM64 family)
MDMPEIPKEIEKNIPRTVRPYLKGRTLLIGIILVTGFVVLWFSPGRALLTDPEKLRDTIRGLGPWAPVFIILYQAFQVILAPIPGQAVDIANGYVFGWWGVLVSLAGIMLGSMIAVFLAREYGRPLLRQLLGEPTTVLIDNYLHRGRAVLWFLLLMPGTPDDLLCFAYGLSRIPYWRVILIILLGRSPGIILAVGLGATGSGISPIVFMVGAGVISLVAWWATRHWYKFRPQPPSM